MAHGYTIWSRFVKSSYLHHGNQKINKILLVCFRRTFARLLRDIQVSSKESYRPRLRHPMNEIDIPRRPRPLVHPRRDSYKPGYLWRGQPFCYEITFLTREFVLLMNLEKGSITVIMVQPYHHSLYENARRSTNSRTSYWIAEITTELERSSGYYPVSVMSVPCESIRLPVYRLNNTWLIHTLWKWFCLQE